MNDPSPRALLHTRGSSPLDILSFLGIMLLLAFGSVASSRAISREASADRWVCEMRCEGPRAFSEPGPCPQCGMALSRRSTDPLRLSVQARREVVPATPSVVFARLEKSHRPDSERLSSGPAPVFVAVSDDLRWHTCVIPQIPSASLASGTAGYPLTFNFPAAGRYTLYACAAPHGFAREVADTRFTVGVPPSSSMGTDTAAALEEDFDEVKRVRGYELRVRCNGAKFFSGPGEQSFLRFAIDRVVSASGEGQAAEAGTTTPVGDFDLIQGERGHLLVVRVSDGEVVQAHPVGASEFVARTASGDPVVINPQAANAHVHHHTAAGARSTSVHPLSLGNGHPTDVAFQAVFAEPGLYRVFATFKLKSDPEPISVAFTIDAENAEPLEPLTE